MNSMNNWKELAELNLKTLSTLLLSAPPSDEVEMLQSHQYNAISAEILGVAKVSFNADMAGHLNFGLGNMLRPLIQYGTACDSFDFPCMDVDTARDNLDRRLHDIEKAIPEFEIRTGLKLFELAAATETVFGERTLIREETIKKIVKIMDPLIDQRPSMPGRKGFPDLSQ